MSNNWFQYGPMKVKIENVEWRSGTAYYRRRIPADVQRYYKGKHYLFQSLKTKDPSEAVRRSQAETKRLDREWSLLRSREGTDLEVREQGMAILRKYDLKPGQATEYAKHDLEPDKFIDELLVHSQDRYDTNPGIVRERLPDDLRMAADLFYAERG